MFAAGGVGRGLVAEGAAHRARAAALAPLLGARRGEPGLHVEGAAAGLAAGCLRPTSYQILPKQLHALLLT